MTELESLHERVLRQDALRRFVLDRHVERWAGELHRMAGPWAGLRPAEMPESVYAPGLDLRWVLSHVDATAPAPIPELWRTAILATHTGTTDPETMRTALGELADATGDGLRKMWAPRYPEVLPDPVTVLRLQRTAAGSREQGRRTAVARLREIEAVAPDADGRIAPETRGAPTSFVSTDLLRRAYRSGMVLAQMIRRYDAGEDAGAIEAGTGRSLEVSATWAAVLRMGGLFTRSELVALTAPLPEPQGERNPSAGLFVAAVLANRCGLETKYVLARLNLGYLRPYLSVS